MFVPRRRTTTAPRGRLTVTAPRAPGVRLTIIVPRRPRTTVALRGRLTITAPRAPRVRLTTAVPRVRLTTAVPRRPRMIVALGVRVTVTSPRGPLTIVRRTRAFASGAAAVTTPKNAEMPSAASTGTDKRITASLLGFKGSGRIRRPSLTGRCGDYVQALFLAFVASCFRNISGFFPALGQTGMFRSRTHA